MTKTTIHTPSRLRHQLAATLHTLATVPAMLAALALPLVLATSCASDELVSPNPEGTTPGGSGQQITITATLGDASSNSKPGTRMGYTPAGTGLKTTWAVGDAFNIVPLDTDNAESLKKVFSLVTGEGTASGTFTGDKPASKPMYNIYHPSSISNLRDFNAFPYTNQVQTLNGDPKHLTAYHTIRLTGLPNYNTINFGSPTAQSSCMKFVLTPGVAITPTKIILATADGSPCFYSNNSTASTVSSLSLGLKDFTPIAANETITAYMMMSTQQVTLPDAGITVTVYAADGSSYTQTIVPASGTTLDSGLTHTIIAKNMTKAPDASMKFTITTTDKIFNIPFPTSGTTPAAMTITWKEGGEVVNIPASTTLSTTDLFNHTYDEAGTYTITITSAQTDAMQQQIPGFNFSKYRTGYNNATKLISLDSPLLNTPNSIKNCFNGCTSLTTIPKELFENNTKETDFGYCFNNCTKLTTIPDGLFDKNTKATNFEYCFYGCNALSTIPPGLFDNNTRATDFEYCFYTCAELTTIPPGLFDKNTLAKDFGDCFFGCTKLTTIPTGLFDYNTVAMDFGNCFYSCTELTTIPPGLFDKNTQATDFGACFHNCTKLTTIPDGLFDYNKKAKDFNGAFQSCTNLTEIPAKLFDNNTMVTTFMSCFNGCDALTTIPAGLFDNNTAATDFRYCFSGCNNLKLNANIFSTAAAEGNIRFQGKKMKFDECFKDVGSTLTEAADIAASVAPELWLYEKGTGSWTTTNCFKGGKFSNNADITAASGWGTPAATN